MTYICPASLADLNGQALPPGPPTLSMPIPFIPECDSRSQCDLRYLQGLLKPDRLCSGADRARTAAAGGVALLVGVGDVPCLLGVDGCAADAAQLQRMRVLVHPDVVQADLPAGAVPIAKYSSDDSRLLTRQILGKHSG